jgi:tetratricopeptide (TPR) repeat protein
MRSRKRRSRSARYPRHWPGTIVWSFGLLLSVALLVALAYAVGRKSPKDPSGIPDAVVAAASSPGTAVATAFGLLVLGAWFLRHLCLNRLASKPGRIEVTGFQAGTRLTDADVAQHTIKFRRQLATLRLQAPTPVPGAAPEGDFLDVLGRSGADSRNVLGTLLNVLRAATPTHAYELHGVLQERPRAVGPPCGVTVQVVRLPTESSLPIVVWEDTWEDALRSAADEATALILPRTRRCRAPWGAWRGNAMPPGLLHAYEEATRLETERRYDEALHEYYKAAELDPMNMVLRLRLGQLQERLGMYLDALVTYCGMLTASKPAGTSLPWRLYHGRGRRERRRALHTARYRRDVLLASKVLADQWASRPNSETPTKRDEQLSRLRASLRQDLSNRLVSYVSRGPIAERFANAGQRKRRGRTSGERVREDEARRRVACALRDSVGAASASAESERYLAFRELLGSYALYDTQWLRIRLALRRVDRRTTMTRGTIALTRACIRVRQDWVKHARYGIGTWPTPTKLIERDINTVEWGAWRCVPIPALRLGSLRTWHEHYNAACAFALPLLDDGIPHETREELAELAVRRLEQATARADSAYIASRRDWLLSEDPDLKGLRTTHQFKNFEVMYLPASDVTPRRPKRVQELEGSRYIRALLAETAEHWQCVWHRRGRDLGTLPELDEALQWFDDELKAWKAVHDVTRQYRHPGTRYELIDQMKAFAVRYGFEPLAVEFPRYEQKPVKTPGDCDEAADDEIKTADDTFAAIARVLEMQKMRGKAAKTLLDDLRGWQSTLNERAAIAREPSRWLVAAICDHHAAMWQRLAQWMNADADAAGGAEESFRVKAKETRELWCTALSFWRALSHDLFNRARLGLLVRYRMRSWSDDRVRTSANGAVRLGHGARGAS